MNWAYSKGLIFGIGMSLMLGTVFFSLIQNSIMGGWKKGMFIAFGVIFSDIIFISLALLGVSFVQAGEGNKWIELAAGLLLAFLGVNMILNRHGKIMKAGTNIGSFMIFFANGFLLNILNPVNFLFWAGLATVARTNWGYATERLIYFFGGCLTSIFVMEVVISYSAHKIKRFLNHNFLKWINRFTGILFIGLAIKLFHDFIIHYLSISNL